VVEPDNNPGEGSRSWIIYVLGGSYPENHPILTTPSLFTDSPTYEDMMLLSSILGPAKPPVASEEDVASAPGLLRIRGTVGALVAEAVDTGETIQLAGDARCLVCLSDFEVNEEARQLVKCEHMFHKICIDQVSPCLSSFGCAYTNNILVVNDRSQLMSPMQRRGRPRNGQGKRFSSRRNHTSFTASSGLIDFHPLGNTRGLHTILHIYPFLP
jgi:hypothetical protein